MTASEEALAVALRALSLVVVVGDRGRRLAVAHAAIRRIEAALERHRRQVADDAAIAETIAQLGDGR